MKLILLDGGPASGKNTLGELLVDKFSKTGVKVKLLDLDTYVEEINPHWIWDNKQQEAIDQQKARDNFAKEISHCLHQNYIVIAIGERFLTREDIDLFLNKLEIIPSTQLYHLSVPFVLRQQRLHQRGPHSLIDLAKDQSDRDANKTWLGYVYDNINTSEIDALNLFKLIQKGKGLILV